MISEDIEKRVLVLDGALGTMVQSYGLTEADFRGDRFADWGVELSGCNDILTLTRPDVIAEIHRLYLEAGADIITTDTFNANAVSLSDYALESMVHEINMSAAQLAAECVRKYANGRRCYVAGSIGPTNKTLSLSPDVERPSYRNIDFDTLESAYMTQIEGLLDGGCDLLLVETVFDLLNAKAAVSAAGKVMTARGVKVPVMVSASPTDESGRLLSGHTIEAFCALFSNMDGIFSLGLNCSFGAEKMLPLLERLSKEAPCAVSVHPNAGLPDGFGGYSHDHTAMCGYVEPMLAKGLVNIIGGCCGTTPRHIASIRALADKATPRAIPDRSHRTIVCGLEALEVSPQINFVNIGERANVAGSAKFARLIREGNFTEALEVAKAQVAEGAQVIDVCMDDAMIDGAAAMKEFLLLVASEPDVARVPLMIDSSSWKVIETGMKCAGGKSLVNSISLKEGEETFLKRSRAIRAMGCAAVVMLFDEQGQADTFQRKKEVAERAYRLLTKDGFPPEDIIFDPNVLTVATGMPEHDRYALDFIECCRYIKEKLPYARISGGVSNLSFAFRGNNKVREAMHSVFLYHAIKAGLDMAIVNAAKLPLYEEIDPTLLKAVEDVILYRDPEASERLLELASHIKNESLADSGTKQVKPDEQWRGGEVEERLAHALLHGVSAYVENDVNEALAKYGTALGVIEGPLMAGMTRVGELFGEGKMFLPQVVKSARVMKEAVAVLEPHMMTNDKQSSRNRVVLATVKGDVHDIGKNIVSVVLSCNGYEVIDLGVMVPAEKIVDTAIETKASAVVLSGLITPSLDEMGKVIALARERGLRIPFMIGGATTSELHTAVKLSPLYDGVVVRTGDASSCAATLTELLGENGADASSRIKERQKRSREEYLNTEVSEKILTDEEARAAAPVIDHSLSKAPATLGAVVYDNVDIKSLVPLINWTTYFAAWQLKGRYPEIFSHPQKGEEARRLYEDSLDMLETMSRMNTPRLRAVAEIARAERSGDDITVTTDKGSRLLTLGRQHHLTRSGVCRSLSDYISPEGGFVGLFALTAGVDADKLTAQYRDKGDDYHALMASLLCDRLAEAFAEWLHYQIRSRQWGYAPNEKMEPERLLRGDYQGIRPAFGYPSCPDHASKKGLFELLDVEKRIGVTLTESFMMNPPSSISGLMFDHPDAVYFEIKKR